MAWPLTPLTQYNKSLVPAIKAADLNAIQTAIISIIGNAFYLNSLIIDGVGGTTVQPVDSNLVISASRLNASPSLYSAPIGYREFFPVSSGFLTYDGGTKIWSAVGQNITSVARFIDGIHIISFDTSSLNDKQNLFFFINVMSNYPNLSFHIKAHINNGGLLMRFYDWKDPTTPSESFARTFQGLSFMILGA